MRFREKCTHSHEIEIESRSKKRVKSERLGVKWIFHNSSIYKRVEKKKEKTKNHNNLKDKTNFNKVVVESQQIALKIHWLVL